MYACPFCSKGFEEPAPNHICLGARKIEVLLDQMKGEIREHMSNPKNAHGICEMHSKKGFISFKSWLLSRMRRREDLNFLVRVWGQ